MDSTSGKLVAMDRLGRKSLDDQEVRRIIVPVFRVRSGSRTGETFSLMGVPLPQKDSADILLHIWAVPETDSRLAASILM